jgi:hypothetical protein
VIRLPIAANPLPHQFWAEVKKLNQPADEVTSLQELTEAWRSHLRKLLPVKSIRQTLARCRRQSNGRQMIGIHLRRTDVVEALGKPEIHLGNLAEHDQILLRTVRQLASTHRDACFFLAADSSRSFQAWKEMLTAECIPFICHEKDWSNSFRQTRVEDAVVDLWMLGACTQVVGTVQSGFLLVAGALGARTTQIKLDAGHPS